MCTGAAFPALGRPAALQSENATATCAARRPLETSLEPLRMFAPRSPSPALSLKVLRPGQSSGDDRGFQENPRPVKRQCGSGCQWSPALHCIHGVADSVILTRFLMFSFP